MKIGIVSGRNPSTSFGSIVNHKLYSAKYGMTYIHCNWPTKAVNPYHNKIYYLLEYIDCFDYLFWIDDDAFFWDFEKDIREFLPSENNILSVCKSPSFKELKTFLSSGQFFIKCDNKGRELLCDILNTDLREVKEWWYEGLGFFTNGDQDALVYLLTTQKKYSSKFELFEYQCFNSRTENLLFDVDLHVPLILHFTGKPEVKRNNYKKIQDKFGLGTALVEKVYLEDYGIRESRNRNPLYKFIKRTLKRVLK